MLLVIEMKMAQFLEYYKELTRTERHEQDVTLYCVTFIINSAGLIAEVWETKDRKIILPIYARITIVE